MPTRQTTTLPNVIQHNVGDGNWDSNRGPVQSIVLHTIVGTIQSADAEFQKPGTQKSIHYGVGLDGSLHQWVDEDNVAYHAGNYTVNQTSIGIEHEDGGNYNDPRPDTLYESSAKLVAEICKFYEIPCDIEHIFRHQDVIDKTYYPGGTSCPDALDTNRIIKMANDILHPQPVEQPAPAPEVSPNPVVEPQTPVVEQQPTSQPETPQVDQTASHSTPSDVQNTVDQTASQPNEPVAPTSETSPVVPNNEKVGIWLPRQAISEFFKVLERLLVWIGLLEEVKP